MYFLRKCSCVCLVVQNLQWWNSAIPRYQFYFKSSSQSTSLEKSQVRTKTETKVLGHFSKLASPERYVSSHTKLTSVPQEQQTPQTLDVTYAAPVLINTQNTPKEARPQWLKFPETVSQLGPPLWSSGQSFWLQIQRSRVRFPALPDFLSSSGYGTGSTQPRDVNWGATWIKK